MRAHRVLKRYIELRSNAQDTILKWHRNEVIVHWVEEGGELRR